MIICGYGKENWHSTEEGWRDLFEVTGGRPSSFLRTLRVSQSPPLRGGSPVSCCYGMGDSLDPRFFEAGRTAEGASFTRR
jgi:hypothetical protein